MRQSRLYYPSPLQTGMTIDLDEDNAHYVKTVLRLKQTMPIILFNGLGHDYLGKIADVNRKTVRVTIEEEMSRSVESNLKIYLGLGISRGDRMDFAVQKAVELGVAAITPIITERCVVQFQAEKKSQRWQHWQKIVHHAAEQSGRTVLPTFESIVLFHEWIADQQCLRLFLDPQAITTLTQLRPENNMVTLLTGPEGGFSSREREMAIAAGFIPVRLGARILRTETASLAALAAVQTLWGDFA
jgi:16S rRNA (uracil1498-N3)-methyltransferase